MKNMLKTVLFLTVFAALLGASPVFAMNLNFNASNTQINAGQEIILSWETNSPVALHCIINDAPGGGGSGSVKVSPKVSTNYTIVCQYWLSNGGNPDSATQTITIYVSGTPAPSSTYNSGTAPPAIYLYANKSTVNAGEQVNLTWQTSNTNPGSCNRNFGVPNYSDVSGSDYVYPTRTTDYVLTCSNNYGPKSAYITVYVNQNGQNTNNGTLTTACAASPASPKNGESVTFAAATSGGTAPYTYAWSGAVSGSGQSVSTSFAVSGSKTATVISKDALGRSVQSSCGVDIASGSGTPTPTPKPTATPKPTPTLTPTAGKVEGASTICKQVTVCFDQNTGKITETETLPTPSGVGTPTPASSVVGASPSVSKNSSKSTAPSLFASLFNIKGDVGGKIKSLVTWYAVILLVILLVVLSYMGIKKMKSKKEAAELDQQNRKT